MPVIKVINQGVQDTGAFTVTTGGPAISLDGATSLALQANVTTFQVNSQTFNSGSSQTRVIQDITYTTVLHGSSPWKISYTTGGTAGSEVVTVNSTTKIISVKIQNGVSTATQVKTAYDLVSAATAIATSVITGTPSHAQVQAAASAFSGGSTSAIDLTNNLITVTNHGFITGTRGQLTTTGTLPAPLALATDYWVIYVTDNTFKLATSLVNAQAGTAITLTDQGSQSAVNTFTVDLLSGTLQIQSSNDGTNWSAIGSPVTITAPSQKFIEIINPTGIYARTYFIPAGASARSLNNFVVKGPN